MRINRDPSNGIGLIVLALALSLVLLMLFSCNKEDVDPVKQCNCTTTYQEFTPSQTGGVVSFNWVTVAETYSNDCGSDTDWITDGMERQKTTCK